MQEIKLNIIQFTQAIETLTDAERGRLLTAMLSYSGSGAAPDLSGSERGAWGPVKAMVDKQRTAFEKRSQTNRKNVTKRYEKLRIVENGSNSYSERESTPHTPLKEKDIYIHPQSLDCIDSLTMDCNEVIDFLNQVAGTSYKHSETSRKPIRARLNDGFTVDDCKRVICNRWKAWRGTEWQQYMRPDTLFRPSKFEGYLNATTPSSDGLDNLRALYEQAKKEEESEAH